MRCSSLALAVVTASALPLAVAAAPAGAESCRPCPGPRLDLRCLRERSACLSRQGRGKEALEGLKRLAKARSASEPLARLLAQQYRAQGNRFWAQRTLMRVLRARPGDCRSRAQLAWMQIAEGDLDLARQLLAGEKGCPQRAVDRCRWALLRAHLASVGGTPAARDAALKEATRVGQVYPEDLALWRRYRRLSLPSYGAPLQLRGELAFGYTSNLNANLPLTSSLASADAAFAGWDLRGSFVYPGARLRPALELGFKGQLTHNFDESASRDASYFTANLRPGVHLITDHGRYFAGYRGELYWIAAGDRYDEGGLAFFESHRGEAELELHGGTTFFAGFGRRLFRRRGRDRWELDGGLGHGLRLAEGRLLLLAALSLRHFASRAEAFDANGGSLLTALTVTLPYRFALRSGVSVSLDYYKNAPRLEGGTEVGRGGTDLAVKVQNTLWSPRLAAGLQIGLAYHYSWRRTRLQISFPYEDHRISLRLRWRLDLDPWTPEVVPQPPREHVPLRYGLGTEGGGRPSHDHERIQDLLRQDEAARRGSSCVN